jgi:hypothetical protein
VITLSQVMEQNLCMYVVNVCLYVCTYLCINLCMYVCMHVCMYGCMDVWMYGCMYVCMYVCMYIFFNKNFIYIACSITYVLLHAGFAFYLQFLFIIVWW